MTLAPKVRAILRADPACRRILHSYRRLTDSFTSIRRDAERTTLIACSGGVDSVGLLAAFASSSIPFTVAYIAHDIRQPSEVQADREHVAELASRVRASEPGDLAPFVTADIRVREGSGNLEARARRDRYRALESLAYAHGCRFVVVAHQADDVLETLLMRLMRGAGPRGLAGPKPTRPIGSRGIGLIRPALGVQRADLHRLGNLAELPSRHDTTNDDQNLLRNAIRCRVAPIMEELMPGAALRAAGAASLMRDVSILLERQAVGLVDQADAEAGAVHFQRHALAEHPLILVGEALREAIRRLGATPELDRVPRNQIALVHNAIRDGTGGIRTYEWGARGRIVVSVTRTTVTVRVKVSDPVR